MKNGFIDTLKNFVHIPDNSLWEIDGNIYRIAYTFFTIDKSLDVDIGVCAYKVNDNNKMLTDFNRWYFASYATRII